MRETKQAAASPEARAAMHELMAAFEAFKGANDARLAEIEKKASADTLLEEKVARIDAAVAGAQARLDRVVSEARRPAMEGAVVAAPEAKAAWDAYLRSGTTPSTTSWSPSPRGGGLEVKAGLDSGSGSGGLIAPAETERLVERRLMAASPMREISTVRTVASGVFRKPVSTDGVEAGWAAETAPRPETEGATLSLLEFPSAELYASPAATQTLLDEAFMSLDEWLAGEALEAMREPAERAAASIEEAFGRAGEGMARSLARAAPGVTVNVRVDGGAQGLLRSEAQIAQALTRAVRLGARRG